MVYKTYYLNMQHFIKLKSVLNDSAFIANEKKF